MRNLMTALALCLALTGAGCVNGKLVTSYSVANPVTADNIYDIKNAYAIILSGAVAYRERPRCTKTSLESLTNLCARRSIVVKLQKADLKAQAAIANAEIFIRDNPTLNASSVIQLAKIAVTEFSNIRGAQQ